MSRKLLWCGDAVVASGFARATHHILDVLRQTWDVSVLGINYQGGPHKYPYDIYPCWPGGDLFGLGRVAGLVTMLKPDVVIIQNDPWNLPAYMTRVGNIPMVAAVAVDGKNCAGRGLNGLSLAIFWTKFGEREAKLGGYAGQTAVVPLGVDLSTYSPGDRREARRQLNLPARYLDAFIVGNVNRNQPRKRLDLCVAYFAEWIKTRQVEDAYLFLHVAPTGEMTGYDVVQLAKYYGIASRVLIAEPEIGQGAPESELVTTYCSFDVAFTTTQGEGFGLPTFEGMACGIPPIYPEWAALGELCEGAGIGVPCTSTAVTPNRINVIGGVMDCELAIEALDSVYRDKRRRGEMSAQGLAIVQQSRYRWENVGQEYARLLDETLRPEKVGFKLVKS